MHKLFVTESAPMLARSGRSRKVTQRYRLQTSGTYTPITAEGEKGESNQSGGCDGALMDAFAELRSLLARPEVPEGVYSACLRLSDFQTKLFCSVSDSYRTWDGAKWVEHAGTPHLGMRLEPSNFLRELSSPHSGHLSGHGS